MNNCVDLVLDACKASWLLTICSFLCSAGRATCRDERDLQDVQKDVCTRQTCEVQTIQAFQAFLADDAA